MSRPDATIHDESGLDAAQARLDALLRRRHLTPEESADLDALTEAIERYEDIHHPIRTPAEVLRRLMDERRLDEAGLAARVGVTPALITDILAARRLLSRWRTAPLAAYLGFPDHVFLEPGGPAMHKSAAYRARQVEIERLETQAAIREGLAEFARGEYRPLDEVFDDLDARIATRPEFP